MLNMCQQKNKQQDTLSLDVLKKCNGCGKQGLAGEDFRILTQHNFYCDWDCFKKHRKDLL